jgi:hypothetical protein
MLSTPPRNRVDWPHAATQSKAAMARQILARVEALHTNRQADSASKQYEGVDDEDIG